MGFRDSDTIIEPIDDGGAFDSGEGSTSSTSESAANALAAANSAAAALVSENAAAADVALTAADVLLTNADVALTNADVVLTNADVVSTNADVVLTNADKIQTGLDRVATNADVVLTHADVVLAEADKVQTGLDRIAVAADLVLTNQDTIDTAADVLLTNADVALTNADVALTNADVVSTNADVVLTNADKIQTGLDRVATNADVVLTNADVVLAEADKVQTGLDRIAVAADLVLTNQDTIDTAADVLLTNADVALTNADVALTNADVVSTNADKVQTGLDRTATTNSATSAANSASTATTKASEASTSATNAATSATNAATSEVNAETAETNAETAEANALASKNAAATSETNSSNSATASANSASSAATSETNAATSASTASSQASTATTKASEASTSATSAATSASTATTKASEASTSATNAATSASNSASSATAAQTAETNAETAETNAAASATTATTKAGESLTSANSSASSASTAEAAKDAALAALDSFDDRYLGAKSSDPTVDNDGNALISGALYYNTTDDAMKVYTGSAWVAAYASLAGTLLIANNLNDLDNAVSARSNLGLVIGTNVQAFSAILAATTASYTTALNNKLSGIELGATTDQTGAEIKTAYQAEANAFTDSLYTKLDNIEELADVTDTANVVSSLTAGSNITIAADGTISGSAAYSLPTSSPTVLGGVKVGTDLSISGTGVLSIADNVIDEANLKVSNSPTNGYFLSAQSGNVGGLTWATVPAGYDDADVTSYLASASSIGIGTSSPGSYDGEADNLVVASSGHTGITIASTGSNQRTNLYFSDGTSGSAAYRGGFSYDHNDDSLLVRTAGAAAMTLDSSKALHIGTDSSGSYPKTGHSIRGGDSAIFSRTGSTGESMQVRRQNSTGEFVRFYSGASTIHGGIKVDGGSMVIGGGDVGIGYYQGANALVPYDFDSNAVRHAAIDLGYTGNFAWKDLYLSGNIVVGGTVDGRDLSVDGTKLDGIETGATADQTAAQILTAVKTVDGSGSGLDADLLDGNHASAFYLATNPSGYTTNTGTIVENGTTFNSTYPVYFRINANSAYSHPNITFTGSTSTLNVTNIAPSGTVDGRDVAADGTKLDTIATSANNYSFPYTISQSAGNNTVVRRDSSGYIFSNYFNGTGTFATTGLTSGMARFTGTNGSDTYGRSYTAAAARTLLNVADGANNYSLPATPSVTGINIGSQVNLAESTDRADLLQITSSTSGWGGLQIRNSSNEGRWSFMTNGESGGIYNDEDDQWHVYFTEGAGTNLYYAGNAAAFTTSTGFTINGSLVLTGTGNVTLTGTVDGRDVAADGAKLDGIEAGATAGSGLPLSGGTMTGSINLNNNGLTGCSSITAINDTNTYIQFHAADQFRVVTGGSERLEVTSSQITSTVFISAPYFEATSDINLKTDIKKIVNPLEMISNLNGYTFNWKESGKASAGVIAQEVEKVLPSAVSKNDKGTRSVNYNEIIGVLIEAVKEQQVQINSLKKMLGDN